MVNLVEGVNRGLGLTSEHGLGFDLVGFVYD